MKQFVLACVLVFAISATAEASWLVARSTGPVWIGTGDAQKVSLRSQEQLQAGATITTGSGGRVLLSRNKEIMTIGPNAVVIIPADNMFGYTTILQYAGVVEFDVEKRNVRHFQVETPFLAAVVKGTHFVVRVNSDGATVSVSRGLVGVANANGQRADITPGQSAQVFRGSSEMVIAGKPTIQSGLSSLVSGKKLKADANDDGQGSKGKGGKGSSENSSSGGSNGNGGNSGHGNGNGNNGNGNGNNGNGSGNGNDD